MSKLPKAKFANSAASDCTSTSLPKAEQVGKKMFEHDRCAQALGIELVSIEPGQAIMTMVVREDMLNGFAICHGGITFALGDTAFAYACNSRNERTVALTCSITYAIAVQLGDVLTAHAREEVLNKRTGVYDVVISNQNGIKVALFRGNSYNTQRQTCSLAPPDALNAPDTPN